MTATTTAPPLRTPARVRTPSSPRARRLLDAVATHAIAIAVALAFLLPMAVTVLTAFMTAKQAGSGQLAPAPVVWHNFGDVFHQMPFGRDFLNTVLYAVLSTAGCLLSSVPVAFALSRLRWRGRELVFVVVLATMMVPAQVTSLPLYVLYSRFGFVGTLVPLILPSFFGDAFSIFLLRQFFLTIPEELTQAASVDGAGEWRQLTRIVIPIGKPAIAAVGLFQFLYAWNDFYNPLLYTGNSTTSQTLAVGVSQLAQSAHQSAFQLQMAASLMFLAPVVVIFFFAQRVFVEGVTLSGVKE